MCRTAKIPAKAGIASSGPPGIRTLNLRIKRWLEPRTTHRQIASGLLRYLLLLHQHRPLCYIVLLHGQAGCSFQPNITYAQEVSGFAFSAAVAILYVRSPWREQLRTVRHCPELSPGGYIGIKRPGRNLGELQVFLCGESTKGGMPAVQLTSEIRVTGRDASVTTLNGRDARWLRPTRTCGMHGKTTHERLFSVAARSVARAFYLHEMAPGRDPPGEPTMSSLQKREQSKPKVIVERQYGRPADVVRATGLSLSKVMAAIWSGELEAYQKGRSWLVPIDAIDR